MIQPHYSKNAWWQTGVIYEIYVRSFQDTNGDGIGDIRGIIQRLDYLHWLGVNAIWLTPIYPSPMKDFGYDISDYSSVHPYFGNMQDFEELLALVHQKGMKLLLDLVPNHTSDQHPWFLASKSSRENPKRDWYIWKDPRPDGSEPNNWLSVLGGKAWEWDETTGQYYYHAFLREQPDLNWRNPEVQQAMFNVMRYWLEIGVDGFRVDVMWHMIKDEQLRDNPVNPDYIPSMPECDRFRQVFSTDQPEVHEIVRKMRNVLEEYKDRMMIGEIYLPVDKLKAYYGADNSGAHLPANFQMLFLPWKSQDIALAIDIYEGSLPKDCWPNWVIGNHDQPRLINRIGSGQARIAAILLMTLRGTPTMYYGDEIGMSNVVIPKEEIQDPQGLLMPDKNLSRDPERTPMQWDNTENAGFTQGKPWLRLADNYTENNAVNQKEDKDSLLNLYRRLINLRALEPSLNSGNYRPVYSDQQCLAYIRESENNDSFFIALNLTGMPAFIRPEHIELKGIIEVCTNREKEGSHLRDEIRLEGDEGIVVRLY